MSLVEILFRPISFFFLIPTILVLYIIMTNFVIIQPEMQSVFDLVCENPDQNLPIIFDYPLKPGQFFIQFIKPAEGFEMELKYYQSYLNFIDAFYDTSKSVKTADMNNEALITRQNYGFLRQCQDTSCLCLAETGSSKFNGEYFKELSCLNTIFSYNIARGFFKAKVNELRESSLTDAQILAESISYTLSSISSDAGEEAALIQNCYNLMMYNSQIPSNVTFFNSLDKKDSFFYYSSQTLYSANHFYDLLTEFYKLTQGGIMFKITSCAVIPNKESCLYTNDIKSNFMSINSYKDAFLAYYSTKPKARFNGNLNSEYNLININQEPSSYGMCLGDEQFECHDKCMRTTCEGATLCEERFTIESGYRCFVKDEAVKCSSITVKADCESNACAGCYWVQ